MPCYFPIEINKSNVGRFITVACGQCMGCRLERSRIWATRCVHESKMHASNCFVTLTYNDDHLPRNLSLDYKHFQDFAKRARKRIGKFRFFMCGEYGDINLRPHYHACVFGYDPPDQVLYSHRDGVSLYESPLLADIWGKGFVTVGELNFDTAAYVARYVCKKVNGDKALEHYGDRVPEFGHMSTKPGIGYEFYREHREQMFALDSVVVNGHESKIPRYYERKLVEESNCNFLLDELKSVRRRGVVGSEVSERRLVDKYLVKRAAVSRLKRSL